MTETQNVVLTDGDISTQLERIVEQATLQVILVSPYVKLEGWGHLKSAIEQAVKKRVDVTVLVRQDYNREGVRTLGGRDGAGAESVSWLMANGVTVKSLENLHAKIYVNERSTLVSSMNMTVGSTTNSLELAILVRQPESAAKISTYVKELMAKSHLERPPGILTIAARKISEVVTAYLVDTRGHCIRCSNKLQFDLSKPLCDEHYAAWAKWKDEEYKEKFCHRCGESSPTSYARPLCGSCYRQSK
jgi:phosphatidylserine/phosphatidylglycerophosphate/cardiolipin synthase-like enzyme